ncbi:MAG: hypothetical protein MR371_00580 [Clostridia bacterium]|nr:hypothetical protein [Clostridia bacterium]
MKKAIPPKPAESLNEPRLLESDELQRFMEPIQRVSVICLCQQQRKHNQANKNGQRNRVVQNEGVIHFRAERIRANRVSARRHCKRRCIAIQHSQRPLVLNMSEIIACSFFPVNSPSKTLTF